MNRQASKKKNISLAFAITLISLITTTSILTSCFLQSSFRSNIGTIINQVPKQSSISITVIGINETNSLNVTNLSYNSSSAQLNTDPISLDISKFSTYTHDGYSVQPPDMTQFYFSFPDNTNQDQATGIDATLPINATGTNETNSLDETNSYNNNSSALSTAEPISLDTSKFTTYTYDGYSVQQPDMTQFYFSFPDNTNQSQIAGSDAVTLNAYAIQKIDFDSAFIAPKIEALGFDEMAIFATSNTKTYKGTEFGIRMDLKSGFICSYVQEPNCNSEDVYFQMQELTINDGIMHHYTLIMLGTKVSFCIDGTDYGYLNFPSNTDYSILSFSICAIVHRFTDYWDSSDYKMIAGNFSLNQQ